MQQWNVYPATSQWSAGIAVRFLRFLLDDEQPSVPETGDSLVIEFPDNSRAGGEVVSSTDAEIVIRTAGSNLTLHLVGSPASGVDGQFSINYLVK